MLTPTTLDDGNSNTIWTRTTAGSNLALFGVQTFGYSAAVTTTDTYAESFEEWRIKKLAHAFGRI